MSEPEPTTGAYDLERSPGEANDLGPADAGRQAESPADLSARLTAVERALRELRRRRYRHDERRWQVWVAVGLALTAAALSLGGQLIISMVE